MGPAAAPTGLRSRVWIVDDSPLEAELVRRTLASLYDVSVFMDGAAVLEQFASVSPPDAVILDWQMPGISGLEVCRFLRSRAVTQSMPILMLTVQNNTHDVVQCLAAGADDFLAKPYNAAELSARVAALVRTKQMHERVLAAERAVRSLLMQLPDAVLGVDGVQKVTFANVEAHRMLGKEPGTVVGQPLANVLPQLPVLLPVPVDSDVLALPDMSVGERIFAPALRRYAGIDITELMISFREVTSERRHREERARLLAAESSARAQAEQASRAKDEFLAVVSHELRTPLNAILGWSRILQTGVHDHDKVQRALQTIERNAKAQQKLIEDILDISRIITGKLHIRRSRADLAAIVSAAVEAVRLAADARSIAIRVDVLNSIPPVVGDPDRLQQIVWNLLSNAVRFTPSGGAIVVEIGCRSGEAFIRVSDTGEGIAADFLPYIFDRFRQGESGTTRSHGGLGLGLAIVRHLAEMHGGSVEARSERGKGSTFTVRLPMGAISEDFDGDSVLLPSGTGTSTNPQTGVLGGVQILIVDDDPDARDLLSAMLEETGAVVRAVGSVSEALSALSALAPDAIVSDIGMPSEDGYALARRLRDSKADRKPPVIALTAFAAPLDKRLALNAGFHGYLAKPVAARDLVNLVAQLVAHR